MNSNNDSLTLSVTDNALSRFKQIMRDNSIDESYSLRITVEGSVKAGISYRFGFDSAFNQKDISIPLSGLTILVDSESAPLLNGSTIDFKEEGCCGGFIIDNPNTVHNCSCHN